MRKFLLTFAAISMAMSALAVNRLYTGPVSVLKSQLGSEITVPLYMDCDAYVSGWQFDLYLPEGMTLTYTSEGPGLYLPYTTRRGADTLQVNFSYASHTDQTPPYTRFLAVSMTNGYEYNEETGKWVSYGVVKWEPPVDSLVMVIFHIKVDENFAGGNIGIGYKFSSGKDTRGPVVNDQPDAAGCVDDPDYDTNPVTVVDEKPATKCATPTIVNLDGEGNPMPAGQTWYDTTSDDEGVQRTTGITFTFKDNCDSEMCDGNCKLLYAVIWSSDNLNSTESLVSDVWHVWDGQPIHITHNELDDGMYTIYSLYARCICNGMESSDVDIYPFEFNQIVTGVNEINANKTVAAERYFNVAGQEISQPDGLTIVLTTYTDGTTTASKVVK